MVRSRGRKNRAMLRFALLIWLGVLAVEAANVFLHFFGQVMITAIIAAGAYYAGRQDALTRARARVRKCPKPVRSDGTYDPDAVAAGSQEPAQSHAEVHEPHEPALTSRARLLSDPMSGVRKLFDSDE